MEAEAQSADYDGTSVWVHQDGECVARFGRIAYEVFSPHRPRTLVTGARGGDVADWMDFRRSVWDIHRFELPCDATPIRFHDALGIRAMIREGACLVPLDRITAFFDPFAHDVWGRDPVTFEAVEHAIAYGDLEGDFVGMGVRNAMPRGWDARRIAYLVLNHDPTPIEIEVTSADGEFDICDGYHRLSAAIFRGDLGIAATIHGCVAGYDVHFRGRVPVDFDGECDDGAYASPGL